MALQGSEFQRIRDALISAFPTPDALEMMVRLHLGENLAAIAGDSSLSKQAFDLVLWADSRGRVVDLITAAREANPGNPELTALATSVAAPAPAAPPAAADPQALLARLALLLPAQFDVLVFKLSVPTDYLSPPTAPQATRAVEMIRYLDGSGRLAELARLLP